MIYQNKYIKYNEVFKTFEYNNEIDIFKCLIDEGFTIYQNKFSNDLL